MKFLKPNIPVRTPRMGIFYVKSKFPELSDKYWHELQ